MTYITTAPDGFTASTSTDDATGQTITTHDGPASAGVTTHWDQRRGVTVAVDGYDRDDDNGLDLTPADAVRLRDDLTTVLAQVPTTA